MKKFLCILMAFTMLIVLLCSCNLKGAEEKTEEKVEEKVEEKTEERAEAPLKAYRTTDIEDFKSKMNDYYDDENDSYFYMFGETSYFLPKIILSDYKLLSISMTKHSYSFYYLPNNLAEDSDNKGDYEIIVQMSKKKDNYFQEELLTDTDKYEHHYNELYGTIVCDKIQENHWHFSYNGYYMEVYFGKSINVNQTELDKYISFESVSIVG